jgi:hypothetical protein
MRLRRDSLCGLDGHLPPQTVRLYYPETCNNTGNGRLLFFTALFRLLYELLKFRGGVIEPFVILSGDGTTVMF